LWLFLGTKGKFVLYAVSKTEVLQLSRCGFCRGRDQRSTLTWREDGVTLGNKTTTE
jgi:hypothetical protein